MSSSHRNAVPFETYVRYTDIYLGKLYSTLRNVTLQININAGALVVQLRQIKGDWTEKGAPVCLSHKEMELSEALRIHQTRRMDEAWNIL